MQQHARHGIDSAGVEAAGNDDQLGLEALQSRENDAFHRVHVSAVTTARWQGNVDVRSQTFSKTAILLAAVPVREAAVLMQ
ncbi:hypothetical protein D3C76_1736010 [compost metagenome]